VSIQNTPTSQTTLFPVKTGTGTGRFGIQINPQNPNSAPNIVDQDGSVIATWNATNNSWSPLDAKTTVGSDNTTIGAFLNQNSETFTKNTTTIINKLPTDQKQGFLSSGSYKPYNTWVGNQAPTQTQPPSGGNTDTSGETQTNNAGGFTGLSNKSLSSFSVGNKKGKRGDYGNWVYPKSTGQQKHDYVKFSILEYGTRSINNQGGFDNRSLSSTLGTVKLPIQSQISDSNSVKWNEDTMNAFQLMAAGIAIDGITGGVKEAFNQAFTTAQGITQNQQVNDSIKSVISTYFAEQATGTSNLQSRLFGAILNSNTELLFEGPALRPFNFSFKLSARNKSEADEIKAIIRFFKQGMAVQRSEANLFLKAPHVFKIDYIFKGNGDQGSTHPGLNLIKTCALQSFNVDYTPEGSYMAYDGDGTMVSYGLQMQFMELEPVYEDEYPSDNVQSIGY
jgi:hypothetical protein